MKKQLALFGALAMAGLVALAPSANANPLHDVTKAIRGETKKIRGPLWDAIRWGASKLKGKGKRRGIFSRFAENLRKNPDLMKRLLKDSREAQRKQRGKMREVTGKGQGPAAGFFGKLSDQTRGFIAGAVSKASRVQREADRARDRLRGKIAAGARALRGAATGIVGGLRRKARGPRGKIGGRSRPRRRSAARSGKVGSRRRGVRSKRTGVRRGQRRAHRWVLKARKRPRSRTRRRRSTPRAQRNNTRSRRNPGRSLFKIAKRGTRGFLEGMGSRVKKPKAR